MTDSEIRAKIVALGKRLEEHARDESVNIDKAIADTIQSIRDLRSELRGDMPLIDGGDR